MADKKPTCFVAMPITTAPGLIAIYNNDNDHFLHVLDHLFMPAITKSGYDVIRPVMTGADIIQATIIRNLEEADLVLCDISQHNPNVFFELGIRTALDRPVAIVKDDKTEKLPFDTSIVNTHNYDSALNPWTLENQILGLSNHISSSADQARGRNSLWQYFGLTQRAEVPARTDDPTGAKLDLVLEELRQLRLGTEASPESKSPEETVEEFMASALVSPVNPQGVPVNRYPQRYRELLTDLANIASEASARIRVSGVTDNRVFIDPGPFRISSKLKQMEQRAARDNMELFVVDRREVE